MGQGILASMALCLTSTRPAAEKDVMEWYKKSAKLAFAAGADPWLSGVAGRWREDTGKPFRKNLPVMVALATALWLRPRRPGKE